MPFSATTFSVVSCYKLKWLRLGQQKPLRTVLTKHSVGWSAPSLWQHIFFTGNLCFLPIQRACLPHSEDKKPSSTGFDLWGGGASCVLQRTVIGNQMGLFNTLLTDLPWQPRAGILCVPFTLWHAIDFHLDVYSLVEKWPTHPFLSFLLCMVYDPRKAVCLLPTFQTCLSGLQ